MLDADAVSTQVEAATKQAIDALEPVQEKFTELSAQLTAPISMESVKTSISSLTSEVKALAADPSAMFGAGGCIIGCVFPIEQLGAALKDASAIISEIVPSFTGGSVDRLIAYVNEMIEGLQGVGESIATTLKSLGDVGGLLGKLSGAFSGDKAGKLKMVEDIELFLEGAQLKVTSKKIDSIFGALGRMAKSADLEKVLKSFIALGKWLAEVPAKIKELAVPNMLVSLCIKVPEAITKLLDMLAAFGKMFDAAALTKVFEYAKELGSSASSTGMAITGPLEAVEKTLRSAATALGFSAKM